MSEANKVQVGGDHYKDRPHQIWDLVSSMGWCFFHGNIFKYIDRYRRKNGVEDLKKARHYLDKLIELEEAKEKLRPAIDMSKQPALVFTDGQLMQAAWGPNGTLREHKSAGTDNLVSTLSDKCCPECGAMPGRAHGPH
jgi:hypothetical protein